MLCWKIDINPGGRGQTGAMSVPIVVTIAGSDSGAGAGIQADLKTFSALGVYGASVITALTAQNTGGVFAIHDVPADFVAAQINAVFTDLDVSAVKIGMTNNAQVIKVIIAALDCFRPRHVVLDPVMAASSGERLLREDALRALRDLISRVHVLTPNLPEAAALLGTSPARDENEMLAQGQKLLTLGAAAVLVKGGHGDSPESVDFLVEADKFLRLAAPRLQSRETHGTGCTLSSAIAAGLAKGLPLETTAAEAKAYVSAAIAAAGRLGAGRGRTPLHHFHAWW
jgi:hydroxymethylpyrimidine/phosphomethylpyrimidine kinase